MIDWDRLPPAVKADFDTYKQDKIDHMNREANLESLKMLKSLKRSIEQDAALNDFEPDFTELDEMIERVIGRLT